MSIENLKFRFFFLVSCYNAHARSRFLAPPVLAREFKRALTLARCYNRARCVHPRLTSYDKLFRLHNGVVMRLPGLLPDKR